MAASVPFTYIYGEMTGNGLNYWSIRQAPKGQVLAIQDNDLDINESVNLLSDKLREISGAVKVSASNVNAEGRRTSSGAHTTRTFLIDTTITPVTGPPMQQTTAYHTPKYENLQHEILNLEREKLQLKYALENLEDKYNDLEKRYNKLLSETEEAENEPETIAGISPKVIETVLVSWLTNGMTPQAQTAPPPINGTPIETWNDYQRAEPEAEKVIAAILVVMRKDPGTYSMIKQILLNKY